MGNVLNLFGIFRNTVVNIWPSLNNYGCECGHYFSNTIFMRGQENVYSMSCIMQNISTSPISDYKYLKLYCHN